MRRGRFGVPSPTQKQTDWNQTDNTKADFLKNKPTTFPPSAHVHEIADVTGLQTALDNKINTSLIGGTNGLAQTDENGFVLNAQLPSYVDDVIERTDFASLPVIGESGKIYITTNDNKTYRWSGSTYAVISDTLALGETYATAYRGDRGKEAYDYSQIGHLTLADSRISQWEAAYTARINSLTNVGNSGPATLIDNVLNIPNYTIAGLGGAPAFSGTANYIPKFGLSGATLENSGLLWDNNLLKITVGTNKYITIDTESSSGIPSDGVVLGFSRSSDGIKGLFELTTFGGDFIMRARSNYRFYTNASEKLRITELGNIGAGYATGTEIDNHKLAVNGNAFFNGFTNATSYKLSGVDLFSSLSANTLQKWDGGKHLSVVNASGYLYNDGAGAMSFGAITGFLPLTGGTLTGGLTGTTANFSGAATAASFALGSTGWSFEVVSGKLVIKYSGTSLLSLDSSGNLKVVGDGYGGGL